MVSRGRSKGFWAVSAGVVLLVQTAGCATRQWVQEQLVPLDQRLTTTERRIEETDAKVNEALARFDNLRMERQFVLNLKGGSEFAPGSAVLTEDGQRAVSGFLSDIGNTDELVFLVAGHTDSVGSEENNYELGQKRAGSVARYLIRRGIDPFRVTSTSYGEDNPVADNSTRDGKRQNRRIEILVYREGITTTPRDAGARAAAPQPAY
ncbi:MAG: OmpA family protein [Deltaproteobacteria bacterium]|nr:OmpA family protein [Deltaproteobacteria bacterium]